MNARTEIPTDTPALEPLRVALAEAVTKHATATSEAEQNAAAQERADTAKYAARAAVDKAAEELELARIEDAEAVAAGRTGGAVKAARAQLQDAEDALAAARAAEAMLDEQATALTQSLGIHSDRVNSA